MTIGYSNPTDPPCNLTIFAGLGSVAATHKPANTFNSVISGNGGDGSTPHALTLERGHN